MRNKITAFVAFLLCAAASPVLAQHVPGGQTIDWSADRQRYELESMKEIQAMMERWRAAWVQGDERAIGRYYTPDAFASLDGAVVQGADTIGDALADGFAPAAQVDTGVRDFEIVDRLGYVFGRLYLRPPPQSTATSVAGEYVMVVLRGARGWQIRSLVFNRDTAADS